MKNLPNALDTIGKFTNSAVISPRTSYFADDTLTFFGSMITQDIQQEFGLYNEIAAFNRILSLFDDPDFVMNGHRILIEQDGQRASFVTSDISLIRAGQEFDLREQVEKTIQAPVVLTIDLSRELVERMKVATSIIDNASLVLQCDGTSVTLTIKDTDILNSDTHSLTLDVTPQASNIDKTIDVEIDPTLFIKMPKGGFKLDMVYSARVGTYRALLTQEDLRVVVACKHYEAQQ